MFNNIKEINIFKNNNNDHQLNFELDSKDIGKNWIDK